jgi:hypothetical protein
MLNNCKRAIKKILGVFGLRINKIHAERGAVMEALKSFGDKPIIAVEIGVFEGRHAEQILKKLNVEKLYLVDPYEKYDEYSKDGFHSKLEQAEQIAEKRLEKYNKNLVWIKKRSKDAIEDIPHNVDFVYIDGNHFSPYVDEDIKHYFKKVRVGGIISGHDYCDRYCDVKRAVYNLSKSLDQPVSFALGDDWYFIKE